MFQIGTLLYNEDKMKQLIQAVKEATQELIRAEIEDATSGAGYPEDVAIAEAELRAAKAEYELAWGNLEKAIQEKS